MAIRNDGAEPALQGRSLRAGADAVLVERTDDFTTLRSVRERLLQCGISTALMSESGQNPNLPHRNTDARSTSINGHKGFRQAPPFVPAAATNRAILIGIVGGRQSIHPHHAPAARRFRHSFPKIYFGHTMITCRSRRRKVITMRWTSRIAISLVLVMVAGVARAGTEDEVKAIFAKFIAAQNAHDFKAVGDLLQDSPQFL